MFPQSAYIKEQGFSSVTENYCEFAELVTGVDMPPDSYEKIAANPDLAYELKSRTQDFLATLPPRERKAVELSNGLEGQMRSPDEIASEFGNADPKIIKAILKKAERKFNKSKRAAELESLGDFLIRLG